MAETLKILHLEDDPMDSELVDRLLRAEGWAPQIDRVSDSGGFARGLEREGYALILSDHTIPDLDWSEALQMARRRRPEVPFLFVSGTLGEEEAVEALKQGATDYVLKQRLGHLGPAVRRALAEAEERARRHKAQAELRASQELLRLQAAALQAAANGISITDRAGTILWVNPAYERLTGYSAGEVLWHNHRLLKSDKQDPAFYQALWATITAGRVWHGELVNKRKDGRLYHEEMTITPLKDSQGEITHFVAVKQDVTAHRQAERALRRSEMLYRIMARSIPGGAMSVVDRTLHYLIAEGDLLARLGLSKEALEGRTVQEVFAGETGRIRAEYFRQALAGATHSYETQYHGRTVWAQFVPLRDEQGEIVAAMGLTLDVTERKQAELELAATRDELSAELAAMSRLHALGTRFLGREELNPLLEGILDAAIAITGATKGNVQLFNPASDELAISIQRGFDAAYVDFFSHIHPGDAACGTAAQTRQCVVVEDITRSPTFLAQPRALDLKLANGVRAVICTPLLTRAGRLVGVLSVHFGAPHRPRERQLRLLDLLARQAADFLEHTQAEQALRASEEELARTNQRLEQTVQHRTAKLQEALVELEHMSYSMMHDMRAPLRAIISFTQMLEEECPAGPQSRGVDYFRRIQEAAARMDRLLTDALSYNKLVREEVPLVPVELAGLLRSLLATYPHLQPAVADITVAFEELCVWGNEALLTQCFGNLLSNAVKFVAPGVRPRVRVWAQEVRSGECGVRNEEWGEGRGGSDTEHGTRTPQQEPHSALHTPHSALATPHSALHTPHSALATPHSALRAPHSALVRVCLQDNGIGIPPEAQASIFGLFQRLHREGEFPGTGIGLSLVKKAVERMGGRVGLESAPGKGSTFWVELSGPLGAERKPPSPPPP